MAEKTDFSHIEEQSRLRCKTCRFWVGAELAPSGTLQADCAWGPPTPMMIPQKHPSTGQTVMVPASVRAKTSADFFCFRHEDKLTAPTPKRADA